MKKVLISIYILDFKHSDSRLSLVDEEQTASEALASPEISRGFPCREDVGMRVNIL